MKQDFERKNEKKNEKFLQNEGYQAGKMKGININFKISPTSPLMKSSLFK